MKKLKKIIFIILLVITLIKMYENNELQSFLTSFFEVKTKNYEKYNSYEQDNIPDYSGQDYIIINDNVPNFKEEKKTQNSFEKYSELDSLGRCNEAIANISIETMPNKERETIGMIKPSGWHTIKYDFINGKYLYNRCHLIGYQLTGENRNEKNLITCTRHMNTGIMLDYENKVANYVKKTHNHVLYRVTPIFEGDNLLAKGVQMEALSIEDNGEGIKFNIFIYNVQEGIEIDYKDGNSKIKEN